MEASAGANGEDTAEADDGAAADAVGAEKKRDSLLPSELVQSDGPGVDRLATASSKATLERGRGAPALGIKRAKTQPMEWTRI